MLTGGDLPEGMTMADQPALTPREAFSVIWYLQEHLRVLPDNIEMCAVCDTLFDFDCDGHCVADDDADDPWTQDLGIVPALIARYAGVDLCSASCEIAFWADPEAYVRPAPAITLTENPR